MSQVELPGLEEEYVLKVPEGGAGLVTGLVTGWLVVSLPVMGSLVF